MSKYSTPTHQNETGITITFFIVSYMLSSILALSLQNKRYISSPMQFACISMKKVLMHFMNLLAIHLLDLALSSVEKW